jgi:hypothetical protein
VFNVAINNPSPASLHSRKVLSNSELQGTFDANEVMFSGTASKTTSQYFVSEKEGRGSLCWSGFGTESDVSRSSSEVRRRTNLESAKDKHLSTIHHIQTETDRCRLLSNLQKLGIDGISSNNDYENINTSIDQSKPRNILPHTSPEPSNDILIPLKPDEKRGSGKIEVAIKPSTPNQISNPVVFDPKFIHHSSDKYQLNNSDSNVTSQLNSTAQEPELELELDGVPKGSSLSVNKLISHSKYLPNITLSTQDAELFHHFVQDFIPSISSPHSHPGLSPDKVMISLAEQNPILMEVFLCCGAMYLAYYNGYKVKYYKNLANSKYCSALTLLGRDIKNNAVDMDEDWLFAAALCLCLLDRTLESNGKRCGKHLILVYNLLMRRYNLKQNAGDSAAVSSSITPQERLFVDSFIFNYSTALLFCSIQDLIELPSPYVVFAQFEQWFTFPIFLDCEFKWMNNPVMGCAIKSYEVLSKLIWMLRFHSGGKLKGHEDCYVDRKTFWESLTPMKAFIDSIEVSNAKDVEFLQRIKISAKSKYDALRGNLAVSIVTVLAAKIILEKIINPTIPSFVPQIQESVNIILDEVTNNIAVGNHSGCMITLAIFVAGISSIDNFQRSLITARLKGLSRELSSDLGNNILAVLKISWEKEHRDECNGLGDHGYKCFDLLFDRETIELITF